MMGNRRRELPQQHRQASAEPVRPWHALGITLAMSFCAFSLYRMLNVGSNVELLGFGLLAAVTGTMAIGLLIDPRPAALQAVRVERRRG
jgi:hypothetical protein